jgi:hypothetical protein
MDAAVLTGEGSFVTVCNDLPDKPLRFLLFSAPPTSPTSADQLVPVVPSPSSSPPPRREGEAYALFGHNGAVIAASEAAARARMRAFEEEGEAFGDPFAKAQAALDVPLRSLSAEPLVPERLDWSELGLESEMVRLLTNSLDTTRLAASSSPTPPASPAPPD